MKPPSPWRDELEFRACQEAERAARNPAVEEAVREILNRHGPDTEWSLDTLREVQRLLYPEAQS